MSSPLMATSRSILTPAGTPVAASQSVSRGNTSDHAASSCMRCPMERQNPAEQPPSTNPRKPLHPRDPGYDIGQDEEAGSSATRGVDRPGKLDESGARLDDGPDDEE